MTLVEDAARQRGRLTGIAESGPDLLPLDAGEQYRFTFAMDACIGCHSCEVACSEQNANPAGVNWRRVGELEGGVFPHTRRVNLSMACNHCLEPTCLTGCPTNAYVKLANGVVKHLADECIGCQYCIWNCPYEVPVFDRARRIVSKCDMCLPRLEAARAPACVEACPTHAIGVEKVDVAAWRADHRDADAPGLPPAGITLSTTRVTRPAELPAETLAASDQRIAPEEPHWPLILLTVLTQLAVGTVAGTVASEVLAAARRRPAFAGAAVAAFLAGALALGVSVLHLGRPAQAWKALRNLRRSWLSREVALFGAFAGAAMAYAAASVAGGPTLSVGGVAVALGVTGIYASGRLYLVPARPVWNSPRTLVTFFATSVATGPLLALLAVDRRALGPGGAKVLLAASAAGTLVQLLVYRQLIDRVALRREREYRGTARLLFVRFRVLFFGRVAMAVVACALVSWAVALGTTGAAAWALLGAALLCTSGGELAGRYLFYVTVTPMSTAGTFFRHAGSGHARR